VDTEQYDTQENQECIHGTSRMLKKARQCNWKAKAEMKNVKSLLSLDLDRTYLTRCGLAVNARRLLASSSGQ
jgi:hypothetical protein